MKYIMLFNAFRPARCCGAADAIATGGVGAINAGTTLYTNNQNLKQQKAENEKNRKFSHDEAELARSWQSEEWLKQYNLQREEWYNQQQELANQNYQQFLKEAEYNSPTNQVSRLGKAGFNPSAVLSSGGTGLVSAASGNMQNVGNISVPSGGTQSGAMASAPGTSLPTQQPLDLSFVGTMFKDLSEASKTNKTLGLVMDDLSATVKWKLSQMVGQNLSNDFQRIENYIAASTKDYRVRQQFLNLAKTMADIYLASKNGDKVDSEILVNETTAFLNQAEKKIKDKDFAKLEIEVANWSSMVKSQIDSNFASAQESRASAELAHERAVTEDKVRYWVVKHEQEAAFIAGLEHKMAINEWILSDNKLRPELNRIVLSLERDQIINKQLRVELDMAINNRDWQTVDRIVGYIRDLIGVGAQATVGGAALKTSLKKPVAPASRSVDGYRVRRPDY